MRFTMIVGSENSNSRRISDFAVREGVPLKILQAGTPEAEKLRIETKGQLGRRKAAGEPYLAAYNGGETSVWSGVVDDNRQLPRALSAAKKASETVVS